ncbi:phage head spike fiber domain-containing protein [Sphingomonas sp. LT1P40]|uniref:phage head spike fiber domain-containing protein n=1 Tax=Alteristakelama amylovorans TaxID=3096166 RepID=UPI002FCC87B2
MGVIGLELRQRRGVAGFDFSTGTLPPGASFARASLATRWSSAGVLASEAADVARFDYHPLTLAPRGLLIEAAQTNALLRSGELAVSPWSAPGATLTGGQPAPDGGTGATLANDGGASFGQLTQSIAATSGTICLSAYVRKDAVGKASRFMVLRLGTNIDLGLDTATGEVVDIRGTAAGVGIEDCGAWWRPWIATSTSVSGTVLYPAWGAGAMVLASSGAAVTGSVTLFGVQLEARSTPSSYVPSGAAAGTRAADVLTLNWAMHGVPDGSVTVRYGFDDGSTQDVVMSVAGGVAVVPDTLNRRRILSVRLA